jgi:hypothetical protein
LRLLRALSIALVLFLILTTLASVSVRAREGLRFGEGATLLYEGARMNAGTGAAQTFDTEVDIQTLNETKLVFQSSSQEENSSLPTVVTVEYQAGVPTYTDEITALIYLPPECIAQSLLGNLKWTTQVTSETVPTATKVTNATSQSLNFTAPLGSFQSLNLTLTLTGLDTGTLTFIYDINSGTLLYERWTPIEGDVVVLALSTMTSAPEPQPSILDYIMPAVTLALPVAILIHQTSKALQRIRAKRSRYKPISRNVEVESEFPKKPFYALLAGATLNLASVFMPWSQFEGSQTYLSLSLPSLLAESQGPFASTTTYATISLVAYAAAILAWISIATHVYTKKKLALQLITIASGILAFTSAAILFQTQWTLSIGPFVMITGGILAIVTTAATHRKHKTVQEEQESEDTFTQ